MLDVLSETKVDQNALMGGLLQAGASYPHIEIEDLEKIVRDVVRLLNEPALGIKPVYQAILTSGHARFRSRRAMARPIPVTVTDWIGPGS
jgi:hypothetical protein